MKRILALLLTLMMALSLTACGEQVQAEQISPSRPQKRNSPATSTAEIIRPIRPIESTGLFCYFRSLSSIRLISHRAQSNRSRYRNRPRIRNSSPFSVGCSFRHCPISRRMQ